MKVSILALKANRMQLVRDDDRELTMSKRMMKEINGKHEMEKDRASGSRKRVAMPWCLLLIIYDKQGKRYRDRKWP
ncbi:hypothetical protein P154DRAFT_173587 [Amniculicola lignicola CBS 123094]|uniref:Uncharacterized protein n=1 Tax=Amniculicola lignicola CBS 123094 TaxID=1392246 RepID=A0A6A5WK56_9PLEO|nr:hypothetical protein P154DRAFT_173587 [Amniculicola lignicola CBS 123094]